MTRFEDTYDYQPSNAELIEETQAALDSLLAGNTSNVPYWITVEEAIMQLEEQLERLREETH